MQVPSDGCTGGSEPAASIPVNVLADAMLEGFCKGIAVCEEALSQQLLTAGHEGICITDEVLADIADWYDSPGRQKSKKAKSPQLFQEANGRAASLEFLLRSRDGASATSLNKANVMKVCPPQ